MRGVGAGQQGGSSQTPFSSSPPRPFPNDYFNSPLPSPHQTPAPRAINSLKHRSYLLDKGGLLRAVGESIAVSHLPGCVALPFHLPSPTPNCSNLLISSARGGGPGPGPAAAASSRIPGRIPPLPPPEVLLDGAGGGGC